MPEPMLNDRQRSLLLDALDCYRNHLLLSDHAVFSPEIMDGVDPASTEELGNLMELVNPAMGNAAIAPPESEEPEEGWFAVDCPDPNNLGLPWVNLGYFTTEQEAIDWCKENLGVDDGCINLISDLTEIEEKDVDDEDEE